MIRKERLAAALCIAGLLILMAGTALAAYPELQLCWTAGGQEISLRLWEQSKRNYVLFLPGAVGNEDPVIRIDQNTDLVWADETYENGSALPVSRFAGQTVTVSFTNGMALGNVKVMQGSPIPSLFFTVTKDDLNRVTVNQNRDIKSPASVVMLSGVGGVETAQSLTSFKVHGNSTFFAGKKAYAFKLEKKAGLGGMEKNKRWILLANWFDISLIRNQITFDLCREIGLTSTPDCRPADLYINGRYCGTYLLTEKIQLKKGRLEITDLEEEYEQVNGKDAYDRAKFKKGTGKPVHILKWFNVKEEPEDLTGGYLLEIEKALQFSQNLDCAGFVTEGQMCVVIKEPTHAGKAAVQYISTLVNRFHNAVLAKDGNDPKTGKYYGDFIDMRSFARKVAVEEFCANYDVRAASQFMYKDADSVDPLLYAGPGWDYDLTYGNKDDGMRNPQKADYVYTRSGNTAYIYHWLLTHEDFRRMTRQVYEEEILPAAEILLGRREPPEGSSLKSISAYQAGIAASAEMNFTRWTARAIPDVTDESGRTFEDAGAFLQNWIAVRTDTLTAEWLVTPRSE